MRPDRGHSLVEGQDPENRMVHEVKRPNRIYWYEDKQLKKHVLTSSCMVEIISDHPPPLGYRYRCRGDHEHQSHDLYGWDSLQAAKIDEIEETKKAIAREQVWLEKLGKK